MFSMIRGDKIVIFLKNNDICFHMAFFLSHYHNMLSIAFPERVMIQIYAGDVAVIYVKITPYIFCYIHF